MDLSTMITGAQQQQNATATQFDSSDFFVRRPDEYEGTLIVLTARIEESYWSYAQEINFIGYLHQLLGILNELRCHGKVGRPRFLVKFPTVLVQVLTVVLGSRLLKPVHIPLGFFCSSLEVTLWLVQDAK